MDKKSIMRTAKKRGIKIILDNLGNPDIILMNGNMLFLPEDFKKLKLKGKWVLYIKKGLLIKLDNKRKGKRAIRLLKKK